MNNANCSKNWFSDDRKIIGLPAKIARFLSWLVFPFGLILLLIDKIKSNKGKDTELKYCDKIQILTATIIACCIAIVFGLMEIIKIFASWLSVMTIFFELPFIIVYAIGFAKALKGKLFYCPKVNELAEKFIKNTEKEDIDYELTNNGIDISEGGKSIISSIISIVIGILVGLIIMIIIGLTNKDGSVAKAFKSLKLLISGPFASTVKGYRLANIGNVIFYSVPLIMTGLSVGIAYKTGLFNIGAPGQYLMGTVGALLVGLSINTTGNRTLGVFVWLLAIIVGMLCGMIWSLIPGMLKAFFNINEVIICIMTNWIAANLTSWIFSKCPNLISKANTKAAYLITTAETGNHTPTLGLENIFKTSYIDCSIFIAIIIAIFIYILINKTTIGYELRACGFNKNASKYAGLNEKRNIILSMIIAGGLAALGGAFYYLNPGIELKWDSQYANLPAYGFNGIASSFLANCNPIGTVFSSLFIRYLNMGGEAINKYGYNRYVSEIVISIIIYVAGFTAIIREFLSKKKKRENKNPDKEVKGGKING